MMVHMLMARRRKRKGGKKVAATFWLKSAISMREMYERDFVHVWSSEIVCENSREHALSTTVAVLEFLVSPL